MQKPRSPKQILYMAPMLGITDSAYRAAFMRVFGGFDVAVAPFVRTLKGGRTKTSKLKDLESRYNQSIETHPQILTNQADDFIEVAKELFEMGYPIINLNMGCPSATSAGRGRGAGLLPEPEFVDRLLDQVLPKIPNRLSIKTRLGLESETDLRNMVRVLNRYPLHEVIVHPRTASQKYEGLVNYEEFDKICELLEHEIVYSGDIFEVEDLRELQKRFPQIARWMLGRGILKNPLLVAKILRPESPPELQIIEMFREFAQFSHSRGYDDQIILNRLKPMLTYLAAGYELDKKTIKSFRKAKDLESLFDNLSHLFPFLTESNKPS